ncbi:hypothetical protein lerEdw1_019487 [Lerista edwardsae]|nr:hypothetical protein lerEdw1_019487 [Lerista edwardsae]
MRHSVCNHSDFLQWQCEMERRKIPSTRAPLSCGLTRAWSSSVTSQATLTQPASEAVSPGQTTKLSCSKNSDSSWSNTFHWYQQRAGQAPRYVHCNGCSNRGDGISARFTASASGTNGYLSINDIQPEDEADFYCGAWYQLTANSDSNCLRVCVSGPNSETPLHKKRCYNRGEGIPDRFTASSSGDVGSLTITNVQPEDEADYYCVEWYNTGWQKVPAETHIGHQERELCLTSTMTWSLFLLSLLSYSLGVSSQPTVTQPASESVSPGQTANLPCTRSGGGSWSNWFCWVQQKPGQAPRHVQCPGYNRGEGIPDRFSTSKSGDVGSLTITNVQPEDEADYYCVDWYSTGSMSHSDAV